jgi:hypothetical protein
MTKAKEEDEIGAEGMGEKAEMVENVRHMKAMED